MKGNLLITYKKVEKSNLFRFRYEENLEKYIEKQVYFRSMRFLKLNRKFKFVLGEEIIRRRRIFRETKRGLKSVYFKDVNCISLVRRRTKRFRKKMNLIKPKINNLFMEYVYNKIALYSVNGVKSRNEEDSVMKYIEDKQKLRINKLSNLLKNALLRDITKEYLLIDNEIQQHSFGFRMKLYILRRKLQQRKRDFNKIVKEYDKQLLYIEIEKILEKKRVLLNKIAKGQRKRYNK